jgi:hypothetical protein
MQASLSSSFSNLKSDSDAYSKRNDLGYRVHNSQALLAENENSGAKHIQSNCQAEPLPESPHADFNFNRCAALNSSTVRLGIVGLYGGLAHNSV